MLFRSLAKAIDYYTQVAGLVLIGREKGRAFFATKVGQLAIELQEAAQPRCSRLSFEVAPNADLTDLQKNLAGHGVPSQLRSDSIPGQPKMLTFQDPKGTTIELFNQWSYVGNQEQVIGVGPLKVGHCAFIVPDPKKMADFYAEVLGFRVSDWIGDFFVFLRCNADHHTVNFIGGNAPVMHHIAFEVRDFSHLQNACDVLGQKKIPINWGPARLGPGHNVAVFHRNHDDWRVEFYAELDQMKDEELGYWEPRPWHEEMPLRPKRWPKDTWRSAWGFGSFGTFPGYP